MEVLVTGGDTDLGRTIAEGFRDAGHRVVIAGARRDDLEVAAKELDVDAIVLRQHRPGQPRRGRGQFPHHLDTIVNVPAPRWDAGDPRTYSLADQAAAWRNALDATVLSAVLTVQILGDHLRSGGSIVNVVPENPREGSAEAAVKAAHVRLDRRAGRLTSAPAASRSTRWRPAASAEPGYDGLSRDAGRRWPPRSPGSRCS